MAQITKKHMEHLKKLWDDTRGKPLNEETKEKIRQKLLGRKLSEETKKKIGDSNRGTKHWRWKEIGSEYLDALGYVYIKTETGWKYKHRYLMEQKIGRKLKKGEVVHHLDGNIKNNVITNLVLTTHSEHKKRYHDDIGKETRFGNNNRHTREEPIMGQNNKEET